MSPGWNSVEKNIGEPLSVPVVKFFINTLLASGKKNVKHPRSQRTSKWHLNFKIYKKKSELSEVWENFGPYRLIVLSWPLVPVAPLLRIPQGHTLLWALLAIPPVLFLDGSSPRFLDTRTRHRAQRFEWLISIYRAHTDYHDDLYIYNILTNYITFITFITVSSEKASSFHQEGHRCFSDRPWKLWVCKMPRFFSPSFGWDHGT